MVNCARPRCIERAKPAVGECGACQASCVEACFNDAVRYADGVIRIDAGRCAGCGACVGACRHGRIALVDGFAHFCPD